MKILVVSDTHRKDDNLKAVIEQEKPFDMLIHLGDAEGSECWIPEWAGEGCKMAMVMGNNDFFSDLPREKEIQIGHYKVWITHGHNYYVSMGNETIKQEARMRGVDIVMYGHTHRPVVEIEGDLIAINPGSLTYPRQEGRRPSFIIMDLDRKGKAHFTINYL